MNKVMRNKILSFIRDEDGQSTTEYILILAVVVMIALKVNKDLGSKVTNLVGKVGGKMDSVVDQIE
jgi:pilus assembly protein Flp/PilA